MSEHIPVHNIEAVTVDLYESRTKVHTRSFSGRFRRLRLLGGFLLFALYFGVAWLNWEGRQAVLWDIASRKFHIFGGTFWPQDFILLSGILIIAAFGLFFLTVFAGRAWCGYACPQSMWTWVFMWAEKVTEGDRNQRIKLDKAPLSLEKATRRGLKHGLWLLVSLATAVTFVGYFTPIRTLVTEMATLDVGGWSLFWIGFFTVATYLNAGWLREQVCFHMCPYGRFQSSMLDEDSLVVTYDAARGESRGPRKKNVPYRAQGLGDCVDCSMCVQVCPTGIDIRDGLQMECIGCAACIDACDAVMAKMGYDAGLVRYTGERALKGGEARILRPRLLGYGAVLLLMISVFAWVMASRPLLSLDVAKDRGLFRYNSENRIENGYILDILNKENEPKTFLISASGLEGLEMGGERRIQVGPESAVSVPVTLSMRPGQILQRSSDVFFEVKDAYLPERKVVKPSRFTGPTAK
ncbi:cytochrome c oxidase accessory protein CcoG [Hahella sp. HN01]|uniref:cytochrome c oxidase accessory protein CcoG n=1 Tax=unclassified Hahella TaxID=2624107 RepID=UPI001C1EB942|nr:cytochrome c oxidase accessory protein CcoG [Hahella sp. HN01]MBU6951376.1 cytochrome c oxidase accessory protein CcoG [Hahella sp. HN01]